MINWKTTLFGTLATLATALTTLLPQYKEILVIVATVAGTLFAFFSKDHNVTGGTIQNEVPTEQKKTV